MTLSINIPSNIHTYLLQKAIEYGLPVSSKEKNNVFLLHDIITNHELEQNELAARTAEIAVSEITSSWEQESISRAKAVISRLHQRVQDKTELCDWQVEVLDKASQYGIKYSFDNIDWFKLSDHIEEFESLIEEAEEYGICDLDTNDLVDIRQRIEEAQHRAYREHRQSCSDYRASRL